MEVLERLGCSKSLKLRVKFKQVGTSLNMMQYFELKKNNIILRNTAFFIRDRAEHIITVAIWTFPFHQNSVKKSDDFLDLILAQ